MSVRGMALAALALLAVTAVAAGQAAEVVEAEGAGKQFPPFAKVSEGYERIVSRADGAKALYSIWINKKEHQMLAELGPGFEGKRIFIATSIAGGSLRTGWQWNELYCYWTRHNNKLVLMEPQLRRRVGGAQDEELKLAVKRTYDDRVVTSAPILTMGPDGGPVIDLDELLIGQSSVFTELSGQAGLARLGQIRAFPQNVEIPVTIPMNGGEMTTLHYSISVIPQTSYAPREADDRVGYFLTVFKDFSTVSPDGKNFIRYVNRWNLQKRDANLSMSPPVEPIVFYVEHTVPVRYRRYVREGILEWNKSFEKCGILDALEVRQQDARTGAFMDLDPEDVRYNFFRWISSETPFAMGPSRVNPETGQILDADIIFDDSMLKYYALRYERLIAAYGLDGVPAETVEWMREHPLWDPLREAPADAAAPADPLGSGVVQQNRYCSYAEGRAMQMRAATLALRLAGADAPPAGNVIDGVPEEFLGGVLKEIVMHEVGHTLGLRHNFKASTWLPLEEYAGRRGQASVGSVMDYNAIFVPSDPAAPRGDWVTPTIGPYDLWAIEYGYTLEESRRAKLMEQVADRSVQFATDEDLGGPDPAVATFDLGAEPLQWARQRLDLVRALRSQLAEKAVDDGQSWHLMRQSYEILLAEHLGALRLAGRYLGGVHVHRDHKGDPGGRDPLVPVEAALQRQALAFLIENAFRDEAFDLRPEVLRKLAADKHMHWDNLVSGEAAFPVHDRVAQVQGFALLYVMNPVTLRRVCDNELRAPADEDALTLPELIAAVSDEIYREIEAQPGQGAFTNRTPMISNLRRGLQAAMTDRLIVLATSNGGMGDVPRPAQALALERLRRLDSRLDLLLDGAAANRLDDYTRSHLRDLHARVRRALDAVQVLGRIDARLTFQPMSTRGP